MAPKAQSLLAAILAWSVPCCAMAQSALEGQEKHVLNLTKSSWAHFREFEGRQLIYFTHLEVYRCGIGAVRYSLNGDALDRVWALQPCGRDRPNEITTDRPYVSLPLGSAQSISLRLTFADGSKSELIRIGVNNRLLEGAAP